MHSMATLPLYPWLRMLRNGADEHGTARKSSTGQLRDNPARANDPTAPGAVRSSREGRSGPPHTQQQNGRFVHCACLPTRLAASELILTAGDGISASGLQGLQQQAPHLPAVVEDPDVDEREEVILEERNVAREAVDPQGLLPDIG